MLKSKPKLIIVEAPQGGGKTTLTNMLRDGITSTILLRLSGTPEPNKVHSYEYHLTYLKTIKELGYIGLNHVLDRSYLSEQVYARLGFKDYSFDDCAEKLNQFLLSMQDEYDIHFILLEADKETYINRLKRDKPQYDVAEFSAENSVKQLNMYKECLSLIKIGVSDNFHIHYLNNANLSSKQTFQKVLGLIGQ